MSISNLKLGLLYNLYTQPFYYFIIKICNGNFGAFNNIIKKLINSKKIEKVKVLKI